MTAWLSCLMQHPPRLIDVACPLILVALSLWLYQHNGDCFGPDGGILSFWLRIFSYCDGFEVMSFLTTVVLLVHIQDCGVTNCQRFSTGGDTGVCRIRCCCRTPIASWWIPCQPTVLVFQTSTCFIFLVLSCCLLVHLLPSKSNMAIFTHSSSEL